MSEEKKTASEVAIEAGGQRYVFYFDTACYLEAEKRFGSLEGLTRILDGKSPRLTEGLDAAALMIEAGARHEALCGRKADKAKPEELAVKLSPRQAQRAVIYAREALIRGLYRETVGQSAEEDVDMVAEALRKKEAAASQPAALSPTA